MKPTMRHLYISIVTILIYNSISAQQTKNVTLQLSWKHQFQFAGYYAAIEKGYYSEVGLSVNLIEAEEGQNPAYKVIEGKADFGVCTSDIILMRDKQMKAVVLATIFKYLLLQKNLALTTFTIWLAKELLWKPMLQILLPICLMKAFR